MELEYKSVPQHFAHCQSEICPCTLHCLRRVAYGILPDNKPDFIRVVNPKAMRRFEAGDCPMYLKAEPVRFAHWDERAFDAVPHSKVAVIRATLKRYFGHSTFYRITRGERLISPKEQAVISQAFSSALPDTDFRPFDKFIEQYIWGHQEV